jgi:lipopolysaccharide transport system permease protein
MRDFPATPREMLASLWRNRELIAASARREVVGRYRGSMMGLLWSFFSPVLMLAVYTFVFSVVLNARWGAGSGTKTEFALILFVGLIVFNVFSECINRAPTLILGNPNYVKKVVFPLEILPFVSLISALYHALVSFVVWLVAYTIFIGMPPITVLLLPIVIIPFCAVIMGLSWALASLGVYLRDISQFVVIIVTALMFLSPIFYPLSALPEDYRDIVSLNPITIVVEISRDLIYWAELPNFGIVAVYWVASGSLAWLGFAWFQKTRKGFADVL